MGFREKCEYRERCGSSGHYFDGNGYVRCRCLNLEMTEKVLGPMFCENPKQQTPLKAKVETSLRLEGPLGQIRPHVAGALLELRTQRKTFLTMDAYRLIEIFLEKDDEMSNARPALEVDLLVLLLGFGDPPNRYLPELLVQLLNRRDLLRLPTWVVMGVDMSRVGHKYNSALEEYLASFEVVKTR